jgi:hypothetical protein
MQKALNILLEVSIKNLIEINFLELLKNYIRQILKIIKTLLLDRLNHI